MKCQIAFACIPVRYVVSVLAVLALFFGCLFSIAGINPNVEDTVPEEQSYEELLEITKGILEKKPFCDEADRLVLETLEGIYQNYPRWKECYRTLPPVDMYINDIFITGLKNTDEIRYVEEDSKEAEEAIKEGFDRTHTGVNDKGTYIFIFARSAEGSAEHLRAKDRESLFHELKHSACGTMDEEIEYSKYYPEKALNMISVFTEGGATFDQRFAAEYSSEAHAFETVSTKDEKHRLEYENMDGLGYLFELNVYTKFMYLTSYDDILKLNLMHEYDFDDIANIIFEKYGKGPGDEFIDMTLKLVEMYRYEWRDDELYELSKKSEFMFLDFIRRDINGCQSLDELLEIERAYLGYKEIGLPSATVAEGPDDLCGEDVTSEVFGDVLEGIERLIEKRKNTLDQ